MQRTVYPVLYAIASILHIKYQLKERLLNLDQYTVIKQLARLLTVEQSFIAVYYHFKGQLVGACHNNTVYNLRSYNYFSRVY